MSHLISALERFTKVDSAESKEALLGASSQDSGNDWEQAQPRIRAGYNKLTIVLAVTNLILLGTLAILTSSTDLFYKQQINAAVKKVSLYSPMLDDVDIEISRISVNGTIFHTVDTPWNSETSDVEKEAVWDDFELVRPIPLTREQVIKIGKDPATVAKFDNEFWGMGEEMYMGAFDLFHQIHCLNRLRYAVLNNITKESGKESYHRVHMKHCVDMLMQHLLCTGDTGFITFNWYDQAPNPQPDFSVDKKCRDWRQIVEYRNQHSVDLDKYAAWEKPPGVYELELYA